MTGDPYLEAARQLEPKLARVIEAGFAGDAERAGEQFLSILATALRGAVEEERERWEEALRQVFAFNSKPREKLMCDACGSVWGECDMDCEVEAVRAAVIRGEAHRGD